MQQQALRDLDEAWRKFFAGISNRPGFRKQGRSESFGVAGTKARKVRRENKHWSSVLIPKVGWVRFKRSKDLPDWKSYRVTFDRSRRWHVNFVSIPAPIPAPGTGEIVGMDRGVAIAVTLSDGTMTRPPSLRPKEAERLLRLQRRLNRAQPGSNRRDEVKRQVARIKAKDKDRRKDWAEKTSTDLSRRFDVIRVEDLDIAAMTRSARGTLERPGRSVRQKAGLNRSILNMGWGMIVRRLEQKAPGRVQKVHPAYTSQLCNACKHVDPKSRKSQADFRCTACGHQANADMNAACNIRDKEPTAAGHAVAARGDSQLESLKREPQRRRSAA